MKMYVSPNSLLQVLEQIEDLGLDRDVERRDRLVADDQLRADGERAGDADPLPLAARELVREPVVVLGVEADDLQQLAHAPLALRLGADPVHLERLGDDVAGRASAGSGSPADPGRRSSSRAARVAGLDGRGA